MNKNFRDCGLSAKGGLLPFTHQVLELLDDESYAVFQRQLMHNPEEGDVIQGTGACRLAGTRSTRRCSDHLPLVQRALADWFADDVPKNTKSDLSVTERKALRSVYKFKLDFI